MARHETYGNWLGPPGKKLGGQAGIYSVATNMTPIDDFRPASPDSFDDDYDDVSLAESQRGRKATDEDAPGKQGVYTLAGKPASPKPSEKGGSERRAPSVTPLYVLVALSFLAWLLLFAVALLKQMEIVAELKRLRSNQSQSEAEARRELDETRRAEERLRSGLAHSHQQLQELAEALCGAGPGARRCWRGWRPFGGSCYSLSGRALPWPDARADCALRRAHLVVVTSDLEQNFLREAVAGDDSFWLGVTDEEEEGTWRWVTGNRTTLSYWNTWQQNEEKDEKDCGTIGPDGVWRDERCSRPHRWICERAWNC